MQYYKIFVNDTFMGIANSLSFRCFQKKHQILLACDIKQAQYIQHEENLYHANWMHIPVTGKFTYSEAQIFNISEDEYKLLDLAKKEQIEFTPEPEPIFIEEEWQQPIDPIEAFTIEYLKSSKIAEMSHFCGKAIESGFEATLSDGQVYHFSLTIADQLNLASVQSMIERGESSFPYHADGEEFKLFSLQDMKLIIELADKHKVYHLAYHNCLKSFITTMETIEALSAIEYGMQIPEEFQSALFKTLL